LKIEAFYLQRIRYRVLIIGFSISI